MPADTPVTTPEASIVALSVEALLQLLVSPLPTTVALARVVVPLAHKVKVPVIGDTVGSGFTVIVAVELVADAQPLLETTAL